MSSEKALSEILSISDVRSLTSKKSGKAFSCFCVPIPTELKEIKKGDIISAGNGGKGKNFDSVTAYRVTAVTPDEIRFIDGRYSFKVSIAQKEGAVYSPHLGKTYNCSIDTVVKLHIPKEILRLINNN